MKYKNVGKYSGFLAVFLLCAYPTFALYISEVNFDPNGSDTGREWVEVFNESAQEVDFTTYFFFEDNTNHAVDILSGDKSISPGEYVVLVQDLNKFKSDFPNYSGKIFKSSFSLVNTGEVLSLKSSKTNVVNTINYGSYLNGIKEGETISFDGTNYFRSVGSPGLLGTAISTTTTDPNTSTTTATSTTTTTTTTTTSTTSSTVYTPTYFYRTYFPESEKIYAYAGENKTAIVGGTIYFSGNCVNGDKKTVSGTNYFWSFGDGYTDEGKDVKHVYKFAGEYTVILETYVNGYRSEDKIYVKVIEPDLKVRLEKSGEAKVVIINNNSPEEVSVGELSVLTSGGEWLKNSTLPKRLSILPKRSIKIPQEVLGFATGTSVVSLNYPNGKEIDKFKYEVSTSTLPSISTTTTKSLSTTTKTTRQPIAYKPLKQTRLAVETRPSIGVKAESKFVINQEEKSWLQSLLTYFTK